MQDRIFEVTIFLFNRIRPLLLLVFGSLVILGCYYLKEVYVPKPSVPLTKQVEIGGSDGEGKLARVKVSITGEIVKPGVYDLSAEPASIVQTLVDKAGGFSDQADLAYVSQNINLARELVDGEQIYIPNVKDKELLSAKSSSSTSNKNSSENPDTNDKININTTSAKDLESLPGVGPATAEKIISGRPYAAIEDIKNVSGIGDATFEKLKDFISV